MVSETWKNKAVEFVLRFQRETGLVEDGKAGVDTNSKLDEILIKLKDPPKDDGQAIRKAWNDFLNSLQ